jgi:hypothetical protein
MLAIHHGRFYLLRPSTQPQCQEPGCTRLACPHTIGGTTYYFCPKHLGYIALTLQHYALDTKQVKQEVPPETK